MRNRHLIREYVVAEDGASPHCGIRLAGRFGKFEGQFGRQRIPITMRNR